MRLWTWLLERSCHHSWLIRVSLPGVPRALVSEVNLRDNDALTSCGCMGCSLHHTAHAHLWIAMEVAPWAPMLLVLSIWLDWILFGRNLQNGTIKALQVILYHVIVVCSSSCRSIVWTKHCSRLFDLFDTVSWANMRVTNDPLLVSVNTTRVWTNLNLLYTLMVFVKEFLKVEHLHALLACKVICQSLQFVQHHVLYIIVVEHWIKQETVLVLTTRVNLQSAACLVKESLTSCRCTEV